MVCSGRHELAGQCARPEASVHLQDLVAVAPADHRLVGLDPLGGRPPGPVRRPQQIRSGWWRAAGQVEPPDLGRDRGRARRLRGHRRGQRRGRPTRVEPGDRDVEVDAARGQVRHGARAVRARRAPGGPASAGRCPCPAGRRHRGRGRAAGRRDRPSTTNPRSACTCAGRAVARPRPAARSNLRIVGWQAIHMASIRNSPRAAASSNSALVDAASRVIGFSHSTALSRLQREPDVLVVQCVRRRDVHDVDLGVGHQRLVGAVRRARRTRLRTPRHAPGCASRWRPARRQAPGRGRSRTSGRSGRAPARPIGWCPCGHASQRHLRSARAARHAAEQMTPLYFLRL